MSEGTSDSLFKLRLSGPLRRRLEVEASKRGLTLTGEILRRIDETFSDVSERLAELEKAAQTREQDASMLENRIWHLERGVESALRLGEFRVFHYKKDESDALFIRTDIVGRMLIAVDKGRIVAGEPLCLDNLSRQKLSLGRSYPNAEDIIIVHADGEGNFYELP